MSADRPEPAPTVRRPVLAGGVAGNRRLTASTGVAMHTLLWIQLGSALFFALMAFNVVLPSGPWHAVVRPVHFFVGFMLIPLILIKLGSTGYRVTRYYLHDPRFKRAGAPSLPARLVGPVIAASIVVVLISGIEMWSFANAFGIPWIPVHVVSSMVFTVALAVHIVLHVREAHTEAANDLAALPIAEEKYDEPADPAEWRRGLVTRRVVLVGGLGAGVALAVSTSQWPGPQLSWLAPRRAGSDALDFPTMNYEGGGQKVDIARWRLAITGEPGLVAKPLTLTYEQLVALPMEEHEYSIDCVTGWTAVRRWRGVPLAHLLAMAGVSDSFGHVSVRSTSGYHWSHHRSNVLLAGSLLVTHINGVQLNDDHGYPARLMIPGVQGQSNIKWVDGIDVRSGAPEVYVDPNLTFNGRLSVSGPGLPRDPAGKRQ